MSGTIYLRRHKSVPEGTLSMIRSSGNLHAGDSDSRAEIALIRPDGFVEDPLWIGSPWKVSEVFDWAVENLREGNSYDEVDEFMWRPENFYTFFGKPYPYED